MIPEIPLIPSPKTEEEKASIGYPWNDEGGTRHKLGGTPDELEQSEYPRCDDTLCKCNGEQLTFYAQIDSIGTKYDLADMMLIHVFVCFGCFGIKSRLAQRPPYDNED